MVTTVKTKTSNLDSTLNKSQKECKTIYSFYKKINTRTDTYTDTYTDTIDQEHDNIIQHKELDTDIGTQSFSEEESVVENVIISSNINININILPVKTNTNILLPMQCQNNTGTNNSDFLKNSTPWVEKYRPSCFEDIVLDPLNKILLKNIIDNNLTDKVDLYPYGLGNKQEILKIDNINFNSTMNFGAVSLKNNITTDCGLAINIVPLDYFNFENVSLIKIDVEHMEIEVLEGSYELIKRCTPNIIIETYQIDTLKESKIFKNLETLGYSIIPILEGYNDYIMKIENRI